MKILDHAADLSGTETHRLTQSYTPPEFVKTASHEQLCGGEDPLPSHVYADQAGRHLPCHTKAATWMSALFFGEKKAEFGARAPQIEQRLRDTAKFWQIGEEVDELWQKMATAEADGLPNLADDDFAFVWRGEDGSKERRYPLRNATEVKTASVWFNKYADQFKFADRQRMARRIMEKAAAFSAIVQNPDRLNMTAGYGYAPSEEIADAFVKRAELIKRDNHEAAAQTLKLANTIRERHITVQDTTTREKVAGMLDQIDEAMSLRYLYDNGLERPEEVMFKITEKMAQDFSAEHVSLTNGNIFEKAALDALDLDTFRNWMGDDLAEEVAIAGVHVDGEKLAELLPTLPRPDADMFTRMASEVGIAAALKEKVAEVTPGVAQVRDFVAAADPSDPGSPQ